MLLLLTKFLIERQIKPAETSRVWKISETTFLDPENRGSCSRSPERKQRHYNVTYMNTLGFPIIVGSVTRPMQGDIDYK